jgi:hypothetical protein
MMSTESSLLQPIVCTKPSTVQSAGSSKVFDFKELWMEARVGIEPTNKGFADLSLTAVTTFVFST